MELFQALPPGAQEFREIGAIEKDPKVNEFLEKMNQKIAKIYREHISVQGEQYYIIETDQGNKLRATIIYMGPVVNDHGKCICGPVQFRVEFQAPLISLSW